MFEMRFARDELLIDFDTDLKNNHDCARLRETDAIIAAITKDDGQPSRTFSFPEGVILPEDFLKKAEKSQCISAEVSSEEQTYYTIEHDNPDLTTTPASKNTVIYASTFPHSQACTIDKESNTYTTQAATHWFDPIKGGFDFTATLQSVSAALYCFDQAVEKSFETTNGSDVTYQIDLNGTEPNGECTDISKNHNFMGYQDPETGLKDIFVVTSETEPLTHKEAAKTNDSGCVKITLGSSTDHNQRAINQLQNFYYAP